MSTPSQIVAVINKMIENSSLIDSVVVGSEDGDELFFAYDKKHKWSVKYDRSDDSFRLWYYPNSTFSTDQLSGFTSSEFSGMPMVSYGDGDFKAPEALESIAELYRVVQGKKYDVDKLFSEILK
jgi:hypothetical protein